MRLDREALRDAYAILMGVPDRHIERDFSSFFGEIPFNGKRGTACPAGILARHPDFGGPVADFSQPNEDLRRVADRFGTNIYSLSSTSIFCVRGCSRFDDEMWQATDKELMLYRILRYLDYDRVAAKNKAMEDAN